MKEYIEIVHTPRPLIDACMKLGPAQRAIGNRIFDLERTFGVTYNDGSLDTDPFLPKDTPIRVEGGEWELCVQFRAKALRNLGYKRVTADRTISFSSRDAYKDAGIEYRHPPVNKDKWVWE